MQCASVMPSAFVFANPSFFLIVYDQWGRQGSCFAALVPSACVFLDKYIYTYIYIYKYNSLHILKNNWTVQTLTARWRQSTNSVAPIDHAHRVWVEVSRALQIATVTVYIYIYIHVYIHIYCCYFIFIHVYVLEINARQNRFSGPRKRTLAPRKGLEYEMLFKYDTQSTIKLVSENERSLDIGIWHIINYSSWIGKTRKFNWNWNITHKMNSSAGVEQEVISIDIEI